MHRIKVYNTSKEIVEKAKVILKRASFEEGEREAMEFTGVYNSGEEAYDFPKMESGRYSLIVSKRGFKKEESYVAVNSMGLNHEVMLLEIKSEERFVYSGNKKVLIGSDKLLNLQRYIPQESDVDRVPDKSLNEMIQNTLKSISRTKKSKVERVDQSEEFKELKKSGVLLKVNDLSDIDKANIIDDVEKGSDFVRAKEAIVDKYGNVGEMHGSIYLKFFSEVPPDVRVAFFSEAIEFILVTDSEYDRNAYTIHYSGTKEMAVFTEELYAMGLFEIVEPYIEFRIERTAVTPSDFLYNSQWHLPPINVEEAWDALKAVDPDKTYGDADVVINIHDSGVQTATGGGVTNSVLADFNGNVKGGRLTSLVGNNRKVYSTYDTRSANGALIMVPNNDTTARDILDFNEFPYMVSLAPSSHGVGCAGVATGMAGGADGTVGNQGVVGAAPNIRLMSTLWDDRSSNISFTHFMTWASGLNPQWWADGTNYADDGPVQTFPAKFGTPNNIGHGASILSHSHTSPGVLASIDISNMHNVTSYGRKKRGTLVFFAAGNSDNILDAGTAFGLHEKVFAIAASSIDANGEEVRAGYSCWGQGLASGPAAFGFGNNRHDQMRGIDFCAPTHHHYVFGPPGIFANQVAPWQGTLEHFPPLNRAVISADLQGAGNLPINSVLNTTLDTVPLVGNQITLPAGVAGHPILVAGSAVLINAGQANEEGVRIAAVVGITVTLTHPLKQLHVGGNVESIDVGQADAQDFFGGTSSACPLAAGIAALVISANPNLTFQEVRSIMQLTAQPIDFRLTTDVDTNYLGWQDASGTNIIDADDLMVVDSVTPASTNVLGVVTAGETSVTLVSVANLSVGQVILFGAESKLTADGTILAGSLTLASTTNFAPNMQIVIGDGPAAHLSGNPTTMVTGTVIASDPNDVLTLLPNTIIVGNNRGFKTNQRIRIGTGPNQEIHTIQQLGYNQFLLNGTTFPTFPGSNRRLSTGITLAANLANVHSKYDPVTLADKETHTIALGGVSATTLTLDGTTLANLHDMTTAGQPRVWVRSTNCEIRIIKAIDTTTNTISIDPLQFEQNGSPVTGGLIPEYSAALGFGRLDAGAAVKAALNYDHSERDLIIRNELQDGGLAPTDFNKKIDSPDIWVRNNQSITLPVTGTDAPANYQTDGNTVHEEPDRSSKRSVLIRVGNIGTQQSFDYTLHAYLAMKDTEVDTPLRNKDFISGPTKPSLNPASPTDVQTPYDISSGAPGTFNLGCYRSTFNDSNEYVPPVAAGGSFIGVVEWAKSDKPDLPLPQASVMTMDAINHLDTTIEVSDTRGYKIGQNILVGMPDIDDHFTATILQVSDQLLTLTAPVSVTTAPFIPTGVRVMRLSNQMADIATAVSSGKILVVDNANHLMPGQYILIGNAGDATSQIRQIESIAYTVGNDTITLTKNLNESRIVGEKVTRIEGKLSTFILAEVTPHDGELAGDTPYDNNNMSSKEVFMAHKISFTQTNGNALKETVKVDSGGDTSPINFKIRVEDPQDFDVQDIIVTAYRLGTDDVMETVTFIRTGGSWVKTGGSWFSIVAPVRTIDNSATTTGNEDDVTFDGSFEVTSVHKDIRLAVYATGGGFVGIGEFTTIETFTAQIETVTEPDPDIAVGEPKLGGAQRLHSFADMTNLKQSAAQAYGAIDTNQYRVTSLFSTPSAAGTDVMAYAPLDSLVFMQENTTNNTINLVLQPLRQSDAGYTNVRYFVFRGLKKDDFIDTMNTLNMRASTGNPLANFVDRLQANHTELNPGVDLTLDALNWDNKSAADLVEDYLFNPSSGSQIPLVSRGMELGRFHNTLAADEFGFEIVLAEGANSLTAGDVQTASMVIDVSGMMDVHEIRFKREEIHSYMDPAAYYGMHFYNELLYPILPDPDASAINTDTLQEGPIYVNVISKFFTKNTLYIDIRNEHGYSYNYDGTYTVQDFSMDDGYALRFGLDSGSLNSRTYGHLNWPIMVFDNKNTPLASTIDASTAYVNLGWNNENSMPQLYVERGYLATGVLKNNFVDHSDVLDSEVIDTIDEVTATFTVNAALIGEVSIGNYISLFSNSVKASNRVYRVIAVAVNGGDPAKTDIQVEAGLIPVGAGGAGDKGKVCFRKWTKDIGFAFPVIQDGAEADERVNVANVIKLRYFRRLSPNSRPITAINQVAQTFTVKGDVSSLLSSNDFFIVRGSIPAGGNHNDGEYSIDTALTSVNVLAGDTVIKVNEAIPDGTANGEIYISAQSKVKTAHYTDNVFGSLNALSKTFAISGITKVSSMVTEITVDGDIESTVELNESLNILNSDTPGNNLNTLVISGTAIVGGNTVITIDNDADVIAVDPSGVIQLLFTSWKSSAPTRWLAGFDKRFIDAKNEPLDDVGAPVIDQSFAAQTGIALDDNGAIFFATPLDFFDPPSDDRKQDSIAMNGGTSSETSFWKAMQQQNQRLKLNMVTLKFGPEEVPVYDFESYPEDEIEKSLKENLMALWITKADANALMVAANNTLSHLHDQYIVLRNEISGVDDNGEKYKRYELKVNGWAKQGAHVIEREVAPASPIYVYCHAEEALIFSSYSYLNLGELLALTADDTEEELRLDTEAMSVFTGSGAVATMVLTFISDLNLIDSDYALIQSTIETAADSLWSLASSPTSVQDDREFYWARLHMRVAIRNHDYLKSQSRRMNEMFKVLQNRSRGISSINFSGAGLGDKKILLISFDPFGLNPTWDAANNVRKSNPGAASALNLHGQTITDLGVDGYIQTVILPVRYRMLIQDELEAMILPYLTGPDKVDMIVTVNDKRVGRYDVERFASRKRNPDNVDNTKRKGGDPIFRKAKAEVSAPLGYTLTKATGRFREKFLETTLPVTDIIPGTLGNTVVIYNQEYSTDDVGDVEVTSAPNSGTVDITSPLAASNPVTGSAGDNIVNEVFFRIASIREDVGSTTKTGHISVAKLQGPTDDFNLTNTQGVDTNFTTILKDALSGL